MPWRPRQDFLNGQSMALQQMPWQLVCLAQRSARCNHCPTMQGHTCTCRSSTSRGCCSHSGKTGSGKGRSVQRIPPHTRRSLSLGCKGHVAHTVDHRSALALSTQAPQSQADKNTSRKSRCHDQSSPEKDTPAAHRIRRQPNLGCIHTFLDHHKSRGHCSTLDVSNLHQSSRQSRGKTLPCTGPGGSTRSCRMTHMPLLHNLNCRCTSHLYHMCHVHCSHPCTVRILAPASSMKQSAGSQLVARA
mmetsp:Transcript_55789/g.103209  ORF Transcript_55789/g.103209 Transcript_55789/m.103209 type:complete len:245 (-) Transcript_55789:1550-2284(-)